MSEPIPAIFGDAQQYMDDPRHVLMFDMLAGDYAAEVAHIVEEALAKDRYESDDADGMLCLGDAIQCVNRAIAETPDALGAAPAGGWTRLSMRAIRRACTDNPDFAALVRQARVEANMRVHGREVLSMVRSTGSIDQRIRVYKMLNDDAYREEARTLDRVKLRLSTERNQAVARSLDQPFRRAERVPGMSRPALRAVPYAEDEDAA